MQTEEESKSIESLREFADGLRSMAARIDASCDLAEERKCERLSIANPKLGRVGLDAAAKFTEAILQAALVLEPESASEVKLTDDT